MERGEDFSDGASLADEVADKAMLSILQAALAQLNSDEQELISLKYVENKTFREIADEYGISHPAVLKRHKKILEKLLKFHKLPVTKKGSPTAIE